MKYAWRGSHDSQSEYILIRSPLQGLLNSIYPKIQIEVEIMIFSTVKASGKTFRKILKNMWKYATLATLGGGEGGGGSSHRKSTVV